jgi:hypothetical protein
MALFDWREEQIRKKMEDILSIQFECLGSRALLLWQKLEEWQEEQDGLYLYRATDKSINLLVKKDELKAIQHELKQMGWESSKQSYRVLRFTKPVKGRTWKLQKTILNDAELTHYVIYARKPWSKRND